MRLKRLRQALFVVLIALPGFLCAQSGVDLDRPQDRQAVALAQSGRLQDAAELLGRMLIDDRARLGWTHPNTLQTTENLANVLDMLGSPARALPFHRVVLQTSLELRGEEDETTLRAMSNLGQTLDVLGQFPEAIDLLERALAGTRKAAGPNAPVTLSRMNNLAVAYGRSGQTARALGIQRELVATGKRTLGADSGEVLQWSISLARLLDIGGFHGEAETMHHFIIATLTRLQGPVSRDVLRAKQNYAGALMDQSRLQEAEPLLRAVLDGNETLLGPGHGATMTSRLLLGNLLSSLGRGDETLALRTRDLEVLSSMVGPNHPYTLRAMGTYAMALSDVGRTGQARSVMERRLQLSLQRLGPKAEDTLIATNDLALSFRDSGELHAALPLMRSAHEGFITTMGPTAPRTLSAAINLAAVYDDAGQRQAGMDLLEDSLRAIRSTPGTPPELALRLQANLASMLHDTGRPDRAVALLSEVIKQAQIMYGGQSTRVAELKTSLAGSLLADGKARTALLVARAAYAIQRGRLQLAGGLAPERQRLALETATRAAWILVNAAWHVSLDASPGEQYALRGEAFEAAQVIGHGPAAFAVARASGQIAAQRAGLKPLLQAWEDSNRALRQFEEMINLGVAKGDLPNAETFERRQAMSQRAQDATTKLRRAFPDYFALINPASIPLDRLAAGKSPLIAEDQALILFLPGAGNVATQGQVTSAGFVWAITREGSHWAQLPSDAQSLSRDIAALRRDLDPQQEGESLRAPLSPGEAPSELIPHRFDVAGSHEIFSALFGDPGIARLINQKQRWVIAPQGPLLSLPFGALVTSQAASPELAQLQRLGDINWLGAERGLSILPSLQMLERNELSPAAPAPRPVKAQNYIGFGDPVFSGQPAQLRAGNASFGQSLEHRISGVRRLPRLPGTRKEVLTVAAQLQADDGSVFLANEANEQRLLSLNASGRLGQAKVLHFATHGLIANDIQGLSEPALALTPPAVTTGRAWDDGLLTAGETAQLSLDADWVILSACNTAAGNAPGADGLSGLARAFLYAGARGMLVTHWAVQDDIAARLTIDVVSATDRGKPRSIALRDAVRALIADEEPGAVSRRAHPALWAAFQIVGADQ